MTPENRIITFNRLAPTIYGRYWKTNICTHLEKGRRTIYNWIAGKHSIDLEIIFLLQLWYTHDYRYDHKTNKMKLKKKNVATES